MRVQRRQAILPGIGRHPLGRRLARDELTNIRARRKIGRSVGRLRKVRLVGGVDRAVGCHQYAQRFLRTQDGQPRRLHARFVT